MYKYDRFFRVESPCCFWVHTLRLWTIEHPRTLAYDFEHVLEGRAPVAALANEKFKDEKKPVYNGLRWFG